MANMFQKSIVHPLSTEPPLARRFPFSAELMGPMWTEYRRDDSAQPGSSEVAIEGDWVIAFDPGVSSTLTRAAQDLQSFLDVTMGLRLPLTATTAGPGTKAIALSVTGEGEPESCRIEVGEGGIRLDASDPSGAFQGVVHLERQMLLARAPFLPSRITERRPVFRTRIFRSILSPYSTDELLVNDAYYHENTLNQLAHEGFNGVWIHGQLRDLVPPSVFPELGQGWEVRQRHLNNLVRRAGDYGIKVYIYFTEPLSFADTHSFWEVHPEVRGVSRHGYSALCTSTPEVREWLDRSWRSLFTLAPGLGGVILITASEHVAHCYTHVHRQEDMDCPRCRERTPQEVIAEVLALDEGAIHAVAPGAEIIAWNWSWNFYEPDPQTGFLERVPEGVTVMGDVDRGQPFTLFGKEYYNDEYTNILPDPSVRFKGVARWCRERRKPIYGKTQISVAHEAATVPFLPLVQNVARKYEGLREEGCTGLMEVWNFGSFLTPITAIADRYSWEPLPESRESAAREVAQLWYGREVAEEVSRAWEEFCEAARTYPLSIPALYNQPLNRGPAYTLFFDPSDEPTSASWLDIPLVNHRPADWIRPPFTPEVYLRGFDEMLVGWRRAVDRLRLAAPRVAPEYERAYDRDLAAAEGYGLLIEAGLNVTRFALARDRLHGDAPAEEKMRLLDEMEALCRDQLRLIEAIRPVLARDNRLGFHGEAYTYLLDEERLQAAELAARDIIRLRIPDWRRRVQPTGAVASDFA